MKVAMEQFLQIRKIYSMGECHISFHPQQQILPNSTWEQIHLLSLLSDE